MPVSGFPRRGFTLAPTILKPYLSDKIPLTSLRYADLGSESWGKYSDQDCIELGNQIINKIAIRWKKVVPGIRTLPFWPASGPIDMNLLFLGTRTLGVAIRLISRTKKEDIS